MPEHNTRLVIRGLKAAGRRFRELVQDRLAAEMSAEKILAQMEKLKREAQALRHNMRGAGKRPQDRARQARRRRD